MINHSSSAITMKAFKRAEKLYNARLAIDPGDMRIRRKLAWCLFMMALYRAGQENMLLSINEASGESDKSIITGLLSIIDPNSNLLFKECLHHSMTVMQLCPDKNERNDVIKLQEFIKSLGITETIDEAKEEGDRIMSEVIKDLL